MSDNITLQRITTLDGGAAEQLSRLLIHVVEDGASVGFLPPLSREEAEATGSRLSRMMCNYGQPYKENALSVPFNCILL